MTALVLGLWCWKWTSCLLLSSFHCRLLSCFPLTSLFEGILCLNCCRILKCGSHTQSQKGWVTLPSIRPLFRAWSKKLFAPFRFFHGMWFPCLKWGLLQTKISVPQCNNLFTRAVRLSFQRISHFNCRSLTHTILFSFLFLCWGRQAFPPFFINYYMDIYF